MDTEGDMSGSKAHNEDNMERMGEDLASKAKVESGKPSNLFLRLPETDRKLMVAVLDGCDLTRALRSSALSSPMSYPSGVMTGTCRELEDLA